MEKKNYTMIYMISSILAGCILIYIIYIAFFAIRGNISVNILNYTTTRAGFTKGSGYFLDHMVVHFTIVNNTNKRASFATKNIGVVSLGKVYYPDVLVDDQNNVIKTFSIDSKNSYTLTATFIQYADATNAKFEVSNNLTTDIFTSDIAAKPTLEPLVKK